MPAVPKSQLPGWFKVLLIVVGVCVLGVVGVGVWITSPPVTNSWLDRIDKRLDGWEGSGKELAQSAAELRFIVRTHPNNARAWVQLARVVGRAGYISGDDYHPEALKAQQELLAHALAIDPQSFDAHMVKGYCCLHQKDIAGAKVEAAECERLKPNSYDTEMLLANVAADEQDYDSALHHAGVAKLLAANVSEQVGAEGDLAEYWRNSGNPSLAESSYVACVRLDPKSPWAHVNLAGFLLTLDRWQEAQTECKTALSIMDFGMAHHLLSKALFAEGAEKLWNGGHADEAIPTFEMAIAQDSTNSDAWYGLGMCYSAIGRRESDYNQYRTATNAFEHAVDADPNNRQARIALAGFQAFWAQQEAAKKK